mgnify:CR=1 FL=1
MRRMITQKTPMDELRSYATHYLGMESLTDEALKLVADGITTVEELKKGGILYLKEAAYDKKK